jgi:hypothetical protein
LVHARCILQRSFVFFFLGTTFWSGTHDFSLGGAHRFSALCLRVAIAILTCMSVGERGGGGEEMGGAEVNTALFTVGRFAIKAYLAAAKVMGGSLAAGITSTEEEGQKGLRELERRGRALVIPMIIIVVAMELQGR